MGANVYHTATFHHAGEVKQKIVWYALLECNGGRDKLEELDIYLSSSRAT